MSSDSHDLPGGEPDTRSNPTEPATGSQASHAASEAGPTNEPGNATAQGETSPDSEEKLQLFLPTAVVSAIALRDLSHILTYYPDVIPADEAESIYAELSGELTFAMRRGGLGELSEVFPNLEFGIDHEVFFPELHSLLLSHHSDFKPSSLKSPDDAKQKHAGCHSEVSRICDRAHEDSRQ